MVHILYETAMGKYYTGNAEDLLTSDLTELKNKVQLILTSPPFPLNKKKRYGNLQGEEYKNWFINLAEIFSNLSNVATAHPTAAELRGMIVPSLCSFVFI